MSPEALRARWAELREAGAKLRQRPAAARLEALARVLDGWADPDSRWRRELEAQLPAAAGFGPETVREGLRLALRDWTGEALLRLVRSELGEVSRLDGAGDAPVTGFERTAVLLAGSIPMPSLLSLLAPLVLGSPVLAKCASADPVSGVLLARSLAETDAELGRCIEVVSFPGDDPQRVAALLEADCVVATGSDATIEAVRRALRGSQRLVAHPHRLSLTALGPEALTPGRLSGVAARVALDVALWDQLGCLSPIAVHAVAADREVDALAEALAEALAALERRMPRAPVTPAVAARIAHERAEAQLRAAAGARVALHASGDTSWTVVREADAAARPAPLHRFVRVLPSSAAQELLGALSPHGAQLAAVALEGFAGATRDLCRALARLGASRVCPPGELQAPPLDWPRDGLGVLAPLARFARSELPA